MNNNPVHIVTGATGGIGSAIVDRLIESGVSHIVLACRNQDRAKAMIDRLSPCNVTLTAMQLDLESFDSVINFVMSIRERDMAVDTIFNNAGTMPGTMKLTADGYESATQTNFLSTALLTQMLLPRIVNGGSHRVYHIHDTTHCETPNRLEATRHNPSPPIHDLRTQQTHAHALCTRPRV